MKGLSSRSFSDITVVYLKLLLIEVSLTSAFQVKNAFTARTQTSTHLRDICEWRDIMSSDPSGGPAFNNDGSAPTREICILPFPFQDVLLQGETKELNLYEDRFITLFDDVMDNCGGVVAMGLVANDAGIIQSVPVCEVESYNRVRLSLDDEDPPKIFATIRVVGRANLVGIVAQEPYIKARCREISDVVPNDLEESNIIAGNIENMMVTLSSLDHQIAEMESAAAQDADGGGQGSTEYRDALIASLKNDNVGNSIDTDNNDDDDEDDDVENLDRSARFAKSYRIARETDSQGYTISSDTSPSSEIMGDGNSGKRKDRKKQLRSVQDLTALSWAAFCTEEDAMPDAKYRVQALDTDDLHVRLQLASFMIQQKKIELMTRINPGLKGGENNDNDADDDNGDGVDDDDDDE